MELTPWRTSSISASPEVLRKRLCAPPTRRGLSSREPPPFVPHALLARNTSPTAFRALPRPVDIIVGRDSDRLYGNQTQYHVWIEPPRTRSQVMKQVPQATPPEDLRRLIRDLRPHARLPRMQKPRHSSERRGLSAYRVAKA